MDIILSTSNLEFENIIDYSDIEIERNKATFICGESGCGKSTLLRLFNATVSPSNGKVIYNGKNADTIDTVALRKELLLVSQTIFLFDGTIEENFIKYYEFRGEPNISSDKIKKFLNLCCAEYPIDAMCNTMSGGEKQRVFIAICLSFLPKVLMLDEPTSALDEKTANHFLSNIKSFCLENGITLIAVSHNKEIIEHYADNVIDLKRG